MSKAKVKRAHKQAKRLEGKSEIDNPYALGTWQVKKGHKAGYKKKAGTKKNRKR